MVQESRVFVETRAIVQVIAGKISVFEEVQMDEDRADSSSIRRRGIPQDSSSARPRRAAADYELFASDSTAWQTWTGPGPAETQWARDWAESTGPIPKIEPENRQQHQARSEQRRTRHDRQEDQEAEVANAPKPRKTIPDRRFRGSITRTVMSTAVPGLGLLGTRAHLLGLIMVTMTLTSGIGLAYVVWRDPTVFAGNALQAGTMLIIAIALAMLAAIWAIVILGTYVLTHPRELTSGKRLAGALTTGVLSFAVCAPVSIASAYAFETSLLSGKIFTGGDSITRPTLEAEDPWANMERVNILLVGADSGEGREDELGIRTDTMIVASIDTKSGNTVLIQLPRNLENPIFPDNSELDRYYPYGFQSGGDTMLNSVWNTVPAEYPDFFKDTDYAGADALKFAIQGSIGLKMDYFVMVNIDGLVALIDAMGGVTVNVNFPIAKHGSIDTYDCGYGGWVAQGPDQHLNGEDAMWYARSRCNDTHPMGPDFGRMKRQSCLISAVMRQANPANMVSRYEAIAQATGNLVSTDIPQDDIAAMVELATRVQNAKNISRLSFVNGQNGFDSGYPDFALMKTQVNEAIALSMGVSQTPDSSVPEVTPTEAPAPVPTETYQEPVPTETSSDIYSTQAPVENVDDACAYHPEESRIEAPEWAYYHG